MSETEQIKACAELDGLHSKVETHQSPYGDRPFELEEWYNSHNLLVAIPNYSSRDVLIPLIEKQPYHLIDQINDRLNTATKSRHGGLLATPAMIREALLRSVGKWTE